VSRPETENVTTHDLGNGLVQHRWVNLTRYEEPQSLAREQVRQALSGRTSESRIDDAAIVASELVTNALKHTASGPVCMNLDVYQDTAIMWVHDGDKDVDAVLMRTSATAPIRDLPESGRGLYLVDVLVTKWFVWPTTDGKAVVAVMELDDGRQHPVP
jgi:anti-sigma regulatory factor (Ser/Thr protein kinase)